MKTALKTLRALGPAGLALVLFAGGCTHLEGGREIRVPRTVLYHPSAYPIQDFGYTHYQGLPPYYFYPQRAVIPPVPPPARGRPAVKPPDESSRRPGHVRPGERGERSYGDRMRPPGDDHQDWRRSPGPKHERERPEGVRPRHERAETAVSPRYSRGDGTPGRVERGSRDQRSDRETRTRRRSED